MSTTNTQTEPVLAGEVCSIAVAKQYGFFNTQTYYTNDYNDTKTFNVKVDTSDRKNTLCKQSNDGTISYPSCTIIYGAPYKQDILNPNQCVIDTCPPGLTRDQDRCIKPTASNNIHLTSQLNRCDEKPTDWYMIPNYHLGNKYQFVSDGSNQTCMKPCSTGRIPGYTTDPVDNSSAGLLANAETNQCYTKREYMSGKYAQSGNFCPIAWVYRLGQTKEDIAKTLLVPITTREREIGENIYLDQAKILADEEADKVIEYGKTLLENVEIPTGYVQTACSKLNSSDRLEVAYNICKNVTDTNNTIDQKTKKKSLLINNNIKYFIAPIFIVAIIFLAFSNLKNKIKIMFFLWFIYLIIIFILHIINYIARKKNSIMQIGSENELDETDENNIQNQVLRQACHALFCNNNDDVAYRIGNNKDKTSQIGNAKASICSNKKIAKIPKKDLSKNDYEIENQDNIVETDGPPEITPMKNVDRGKLAAKILIIIGISIPVIYAIFIAIGWIYNKLSNSSLMCYLTYIIDIVTFNNINSRALTLDKCVTKPVTNLSSI